MDSRRTATCRAALALAAAATVTVAVHADRPASQQRDRPPNQSLQLNDDDVIRSGTAYVERYRRDVAFLLADETYDQSRRDESGREIERRAMTGELFLTYVERDGMWVAVHDVVTVDGQPVAHRDDLQTLLRRGGMLRGIARLVAQRNAGFNLGRIFRNFNEPTLALMLLEPNRVGNVQFTRRSVVRSDGPPLVRFAFEERGRSTLVRAPGGPARARGEMTIEAGTGRVRHTRFEIDQGSLRAELVTEYAHDESLDMWLPSVFTERYEGDVDGEREVIVTRAEYTNYRRFTATGRIKR